MFVVCHSLSPVKLASLPPLWWQLRGDEWHSSFSLSVCPSPPVSLCQSFQGLPAQICQADGGPAFYMSLEGRPGNTICGPQCSVFEPCETQMENRCNAMRGPDSLKNPSVSCLSVSTFCWAPLEELCIFYLSLEIRLDPDESIGCTHRHTLSHTHIHTLKWASFCYWKVGNYGERGEGQLGFAYVVERRNYISHKARRWKWTSCPWFVDQIPSSWLRNHRIIRTKKLWATLFVPPLLFPRTEVILLPLPPSCSPCANVWCTVLHLFSFSHRKSEGSSPAPPKLSCELPPFV